jgi:hypothetical protein
VRGQRFNAFGRHPVKKVSEINQSINQLINQSINPLRRKKSVMTPEREKLVQKKMIANFSDF